MTERISAPSLPANDNDDPYATAGGAYFRMLLRRAALHRLDPAGMTPEQSRLWRLDLAQVESLLRLLRPYL